VALKLFSAKRGIAPFVVGILFWAVVVVIVVGIIANDSSQSGCPVNQAEACAEYYDDLRGEVGIP